MNDNKNIFIKELITLIKVSEVYADAKWYGLSDDDRNNPIESAQRHAKKIMA